MFFFDRFPARRTRTGDSRNSLEGKNEGLVPNTWQLIRKPREGAEEVIESAVACFDVSDDGRLIFSNGRQITERLASGARNIVAQGEMVQEVEFLR